MNLSTLQPFHIIMSAVIFVLVYLVVDRFLTRKTRWNVDIIQVLSMSMGLVSLIVLMKLS